MDIKGILFDKDGTLIEFHSFWVQAAKRVVPEFLTENQISPDQKHADVVMEAMGVFGDDIDPNGALAYKSNKEIADLYNRDESFSHPIVYAYNPRLHPF